MTERALLRRFLVMVRQWMLRYDIGLHAITVDDLVAYAMAGVERAARGDVGGHAGHSRSESTRAAYERRIDELYAGGKPNTHGVRVLDRLFLCLLDGLQRRRVTERDECLHDIAALGVVLGKVAGAGEVVVPEKSP
jgi:hypothetical protein